MDTSRRNLLLRMIQKHCRVWNMTEAYAWPTSIEAADKEGWVSITPSGVGTCMHRWKYGIGRAKECKAL